MYQCSFVDRDMAMRFRGGGVGHKSTRVATDSFLTDRDRLDCQVGTMGNEAEDNDDGCSDGEGQPADDTIDDDKRMDEDGDEEDVIHVDHWNDEDDWEEDNEDEEDLTDDALGPDDGEVDDDDVAGLGFGAF